MRHPRWPLWTTKKIDLQPPEGTNFLNEKYLLCLILLLEGQCPAEFSSSQLQNTCLDPFSESEAIDYLVQVCLIRVGGKLCRTVVFQEQVWTLLNYYMLGQRFSTPVLAPPRSAHFVCFSLHFRPLFYSTVSALRSGLHRIFRHHSSSKRAYMFHSKGIEVCETWI